MIRQQAHDRDKKTFHGAGNVREIQAGEWFRLTGHPDYALELAEDAEFTITRLHFIATNKLPGLNSGGMDYFASAAMTIDLEQINFMRPISNRSSLRGAKRRGNPCGLLDCRGPSGLAMTAVLFGLQFVDLL